MRDRSSGVMALAASGVAISVAALLWRRRRKVGGGGGDAVLEFISRHVAGIVSRAVTKSCTAPVENCAIALQCQHLHLLIATGRMPRYGGVLDFWRRTVRERGVVALWAGNANDILRYVPNQSVGVVMGQVKRQIKRLFPKYDPKTQFLHCYATDQVSGVLAGLLGVAITWPLHMERILRAVDFAGKYEGVISIPLAILREHGWLALYRGIGASLPGTFLYRFVYFGATDVLRLVNPGARAAALADFVSYPFETVQMRLAIDNAFSEGGPLLRGTWHCLRSIIAQEGASALWVGYGWYEFRVRLFQMLLAAAYNWINAPILDPPSEESLPSGITQEDLFRLSRKIAVAGYYDEEDPVSTIKMLCDTFFTISDGAPAITRAQLEAFTPTLSFHDSFVGVKPWVVESALTFFDLFDIDQNEQLSFHEYASAVTTITTLSSAADLGIDEETLLDRIFVSLDLDGSGYLEIAELDTWLKFVERIGGITPGGGGGAAGTRDLLTEFDLDKDDRISREEFTGMSKSPLLQLEPLIAYFRLEHKMAQIAEQAGGDSGTT